MSKYGPMKWWKRNQGAYHVDAGDNLPTGVTLASVDSWVFERVTGANPETRASYTANVTVAHETIVAGAQSAKAASGIDFTIEVGGGQTAPPNGGDYWLVFTCTRSDGYLETVEVGVVVKP